MQISNNQSLNFGMALKITPEAANGLKRRISGQLNNATNSADVAKIKQSAADYYEQLSKYGEELKDTKHFDLIMDGEHATPIIKSKYAPAYEAPFEVIKPSAGDDYVELKARYAGTPSGNLKVGDKYSAIIKFENAKAAEEGYGKLINIIDESNTNLEETAEILKMMEKGKEVQAGIQTQKNKATTELDTTLDDLMQKFSSDHSKWEGWEDAQ